MKDDMKQELLCSTNQPRQNSHSTFHLSEIRWGIAGLGSRGQNHLDTLLMLDQARVTALSDSSDGLEEEAEKVRQHCGTVPITFGAETGDTGWRQLIERTDVDAVVICSPWSMHATMAVAAMEAGKHAFVEVPAAMTVEECWQLVETAEATGLHCMMLENCNYGREELMLLNMVQQGLLGELLHGEAAYVHELRSQMINEYSNRGGWRTAQLADSVGNLYPTHGVGPLAHCMNVNRGDYFENIVSMSSPARGRALYAREHLAPEHRWNQIEQWNAGDINTSLIQLVSGKTLMVQWDETTPRPYTRHNFLQGTRGAFGSFPGRIALDYRVADLPDAVRYSVPQHEGRTNYHQWDTHMEPWFEAYDHPLWRQLGTHAEEHGGHGGMDYIMFWRIQECLLAGLPMDQSVYDAALWSSIGPLSRASVEQRSTAQTFPDFTRGKWKTASPIPLALCA